MLNFKLITSEIYKKKSINQTTIYDKFIIWDKLLNLL